MWSKPNVIDSVLLAQYLYVFRDSQGNQVSAKQDSGCDITNKAYTGLHEPVLNESRARQINRFHNVVK